MKISGGRDRKGLFGVFEKVGLIIWGSEKIARHHHLRSKSQGVPPWLCMFYGIENSGSYQKNLPGRYLMYTVKP